MPLQGVHNIHGNNGLPASVFGVGDGIPDDGLKKYLENITSFFIDQARYALDAAATGETTNGRLGYALDVIAKYLAMAFGAALSKS